MPITLILAAMLVLNHFAPLMADDFCYAASTFSDVWGRAVEEYFTWNGRLPAHFFGPLFSLAPGWVFDVANTAVFTLLLGLMSVLALARRPRLKDLVWPPVLAFFLLWFGVADFGQAMLWQMGSANYLWTTTIVVAFLIPFRFLAEGENLFEGRVALAVAFPVFAVVSGWTNENTAATASLLAAVAVAVDWSRNGGTKLWAVTALAGHAMGLAAMVMSPGHHVRLASPVFQAWADLPWLTRLFRFAPNAVSAVASASAIWIATIAGAILLHRNRRDLTRSERFQAFVALAFVLAAVINNLVLVLAPMAPRRALTGGAVYLSVAAMILILTTLRFATRRSVVVAAVSGLVALTVSVVHVTIDYHALDRMVRLRQSAISVARDSGTKSIELEPIVVPRSRHMYWGSITDITYLPDHWANNCFARYVGLDSVRLVTPLEDGSNVSFGPDSPTSFEDGVTVEDVAYSPTHGCLSIELGSPNFGLLEGSFLDVRILSDSSPWHQKLINSLRRSFFPETESETFEYPYSRLRKIAVFGSFTIHSIFLDAQSMVDSGTSVVVFVPLTEKSKNIEALLIGKRRAHDASMVVHRLR